MTEYIITAFVTGRELYFVEAESLEAAREAWESDPPTPYFTEIDDVFEIAVEEA